MFDGVGRRVKPKKAASVHAHEQLGTARIGTFGNHAGKRKLGALSFDVPNGQRVASNRELLFDIQKPETRTVYEKRMSRRWIS